MRFRLLLLLFVFTTALSAQPSHPRFKTLGAEQGLSQSVVQKIIQSRDGFIWAATQDGLNRFDGYRFKVYRKGAPPYGLSWSNVKDMVEDSATGQLWLGTVTRGVCVLNPATQVVQRLPQGSVPLLSENVTALALSPSEVWVATTKGISVLQKSTGAVVKNLPLEGKEISQTLITGKYALAFNKSGGLHLLNADRHTAINAFAGLQVFGKDTIEFWSAQQMGDSVFVCTRQGLFKGLFVQGKLSLPFQPVPIITCSGMNFTGQYVFSYYTDGRAPFNSGNSTGSRNTKPSLVFSIIPRPFLQPATNRLGPKG